jgi:hypothetical protein
VSSHLIIIGFVTHHHLCSSSKFIIIIIIIIIIMIFFIMARGVLQEGKKITLFCHISWLEIDIKFGEMVLETRSWKNTSVGTRLDCSAPDGRNWMKLRPW